MLRKTLFAAVAAMFAVVASPSGAHSWGAYHVGYTHVTPASTTHYGAIGNYGASRTGNASAYANAVSGTHYGTTTTHAAVGGYHYGGYSGANVRTAGVYRRW